MAWFRQSAVSVDVSVVQFAVNKMLCGFPGTNSSFSPVYPEKPILPEKRDLILRRRLSIVKWIERRPKFGPHTLRLCASPKKVTLLEFRMRRLEWRCTAQRGLCQDRIWRCDWSKVFKWNRSSHYFQAVERKKKSHKNGRNQVNSMPRIVCIVCIFQRRFGHTDKRRKAEIRTVMDGRCSGIIDLLISPCVVC